MSLLLMTVYILLGWTVTFLTVRNKKDITELALRTERLERRVSDLVIQKAKELTNNE
jgi:hypothetical protein